MSAFTDRIREEFDKLWDSNRHPKEAETTSQAIYKGPRDIAGNSLTLQISPEILGRLQSRSGNQIVVSTKTAEKIVLLKELGDKNTRRADLALRAVQLPVGDLAYTTEAKTNAILARLPHLVEKTMENLPANRLLNTLQQLDFSSAALTREGTHTQTILGYKSTSSSIERRHGFDPGNNVLLPKTSVDIHGDLPKAIASASANITFADSDGNASGGASFYNEVSIGGGGIDISVSYSGGGINIK